MLSFFRINDPYRLVFVLLALIFIRIGQGFFIDATSFYELKWILLGEWLSSGFMLYSETFDYTGPFAAAVYKSIDFLFGRSFFFHHMMSSLVIIIQAAIFNNILLKNKAYNENSYLPSFLYMILAASIPDFMALSPQLLSLTFILLAMGQVLRRIDNQVTDELFLSCGLFIGIATMFYLPAAVFFLVFLFSLILFTTAVLRRLLLYFFGFLLVFGFCALYFFWFSSLEVFIQSYIISNLILPADSLMTFDELLIISSPFLFILILSVIKTWSAARLTNFQQKVQQVIWLMLLGAMATFFLSNEKAGHELFFLVPTLTYFWTHYFILLKRWLFQVLMPGLLIFGLLYFSVFAYQNLTRPLLVAPPMAMKENTMILGEQLMRYQNHEISTPCFNQYLSEKAFQGLDYYEPAIHLYQIFTHVDPEIIQDEMGIMPKLQYRFPYLEEGYRKTGEKVYERINN